MKYNKLGFVICAAAAIVMTGCKYDESKHHYDNKVFISATSFSREMRIEEDVKTMSHDLQVNIAKKESFDVSVTLRAAPELIDSYRAFYYDDDVLVLPEKHYDISDAEVKIDSGKVAADPLTLEFTDLDQLDLEKRYVLPVTISSANIDVLNGARTIYYLFKEASLVNFVADIYQNKLWPGPDDWNDATPFANMSTFTMEALIFAHEFSNPSGISTVMGIEDNFLIRIGDNGISKNQIQVAYAAREGDSEPERENVTAETMKLQTGRWYHIAVTFDNGEIKAYLDGSLKASGMAVTASHTITSVDFSAPHSDEDDGKPRCFWIGYSYNKDRSLNGMIGEARVWNRALSESEINSANHFYKVDPQSNGLIAYWKFDEGSGNVVKDHTSWGNDLYCDSDKKLKWFAVSLPVKE